MDDQKLAAEGAGAAIALGGAWKAWRWLFPKTNGAEPTLLITVREMLCKMDKKLDDILGRLRGHDQRLEILDGRTYEVQRQLSHHIDEETIVQEGMDQKLDCLIRQKDE